MSCGKCILPTLNGIGRNLTESVMKYLTYVEWHRSKQKNDLFLKSETNRFLFFYLLSFNRFRYHTSAFRKLDVRLVSAKLKMK